jgi:hypothetical protein
MVFRQNSHEGYLHVDHSNSPGLPPEIARRCGYDPRHCGEGQVYETATMGCAHCGIAVVKNPFRMRARTYCVKCDNRYVCDYCAWAMAQPGYVHASIEKKADLVMTGRWALAGSPTNPVLTPIIT